MFFADDNSYLPQQGENFHMPEKHYVQQSRVMMPKSPTYTGQGYEQNSQFQGTAPVNVNLPHHQDPTRKTHHPVNGFAKIHSSYKPQSQYTAAQPVPINTHQMHSAKGQSSQQTHQAYNRNHPKPLASVQSKVPTGGSLPSSKIPVNSPVLWHLSQEVREWKFLGRYLDLDEETIDEIDYNTKPNRTREKALKVLTEWVNSSTPTWQALGEALLDAEYMMMYEKLLELISGF